MKITEKLDNLEKKHNLFKSLGLELMIDTFGKDFKERLNPLQNRISSEIVFEEDGKLYRTVFRVANLEKDQYHITSQGGSLYKEIDDSMIEHYLYQLNYYEKKLEHYKKIINHPSIRLRSIYSNNPHYNRLYD